MKKALILTYYWPPSGGSGVQRWVKFAKYFRDFGVEPVIYTVENPNYAIEDPLIEEELPEEIKVIRRPIKEPNNLISRFKGSKGIKKTSAGFLNPNPSRKERFMQYIRANYFIPDARKFWIKPSVKYLSRYLKENSVDLIISTGPPHSVNLIGLGLKKNTGLPWIADFRDPWTEIDYFHHLPHSKKTIKKHHQMEQEVLRSADAVVVVGEQMKKSFDRYSDNVHVIYNGFDDELKEGFVPKMDEAFSIVHIGLMNSDRNPYSLWKAIAELSVENEEFAKKYKLKLIGKVAADVDKALIENGIKNVERLGYIPHKEAIRHQHESQILLLAVNKIPGAKGVLTGKIFEYLKAKRPILAIGPEDGDLAAVINETKAGIIIDFDDVTKIKAQLAAWFEAYQKGELKVQSENIEQFHRKNLTGEMVELVESIFTK
jgi:hypothetical protein